MLLTADMTQLPAESGDRLWKEQGTLTLLAHFPSGSRSPGKWLWLCPGGAGESLMAGWYCSVSLGWAEPPGIGLSQSSLSTLLGQEGRGQGKTTPDPSITQEAGAPSRRLQDLP